MNIWEIDKLLLFIAFIIPGFVSLKTYELLFPSERIESGKQITEALTYSCINYALLFWFIVEIEESDVKDTATFLYFSFYLFVLFIFPILLVFMWKWIRNNDLLLKNVPHPTQKPWDFVFSQRKRYWVKITLKNGTQLGGKYAQNSFASSSPSDEQIYLEESWILNENGGFERKKNQTAGVIILSSEISFIELMELYGKEESDNE